MDPGRALSRSPRSSPLSPHRKRLASTFRELQVDTDSGGGGAGVGADGFAPSTKLQAGGRNGLLQRRAAGALSPLSRGVRSGSDGGFDLAPLRLPPSAAARQAAPDPGTPFPSERFTHTTYTTYVKGTKYTRYEIRDAPFVEPSFGQARPNLYQTTYKTLRKSADGRDTWYSQVHIWYNSGGGSADSPGTPSTPKRKVRSIDGLQQGQISPRRFSTDMLSSPI